jgi:hypothetical protein
MRKHFIGAVVALTTLLRVTAGAACGHTNDGTDYCGPERIQLLYIASSGAVYVRMSSVFSPLPTGFACSLVSGQYALLDTKSNGFKQVYSTLLTAHLSGAPVTVVMDPQKAQCTISYVTL